MKKPKPETNWFFVDESGDTAFYNRRGEMIVDLSPSSSLFILGFIETTQPVAIRRSLAELRDLIRDNPNFTNIPSLRKTLIAFHAKDDHPEIRKLVFQAIKDMSFKSQFIVVRKKQIVREFDVRYRRREGELFDQIASMLFRDSLHCYQQNRIIFAHRGSKTRQKPLHDAIQYAVDEFALRFGQINGADFAVQSHQPNGEPCISVADYMNWALYQYFANDDRRYYDLVSDKVSLILDRYHPEGIKRYTRRYPL